MLEVVTSKAHQVVAAEGDVEVRIALQFPDHLLEDSVDVQIYLTGKHIDQRSVAKFGFREIWAVSRGNLVNLFW